MENIRSTEAEDGWIDRISTAALKISEYCNLLEDQNSSASAEKSNLSDSIEEM